MISVGPDKPEAERTMRMFGGRVRALRTEAGFSQRDLAARCFTTEWHISEIERGISVPNVLVLGVLAHALGVLAGDLIDGLTPALRSASTAQMLDLLAREHRPTTQQVAEALELPGRYAAQTLNYLRSIGEIEGARSGWEPATQPARSTKR
jgi:transcriptional regulator with XRE-family HTH domain